jgi:uncharacterized RmlC-like cupin family protein
MSTGMESYIARFADLKPSKAAYEHESIGVPVGAYEMLAARDIYRIVAPDRGARSITKPAIVSNDGFQLGIVECPPGNGAALHKHELTQETFMPLTGRFEVTWGDKGEHCTVLGLFDVFAVPVGIYRSFRNIESSPSKMLVYVRGSEQAVMNDLVYDKASGDAIKAAYGQTVHENLGRIGITFSQT